MKKYTYKGNLYINHEQGCGPYPILYDDRGLDQNGYYSWNWTFVFIKKSDTFITIWDNDDNIVYQGKWSFSRKNTSINNFFFSPKEIEPSLWKEWCQKMFKAEVISDNPVEIDRVYINVKNIWKKIIIMKYNSNDIIAEGNISKLELNKNIIIHQGLKSIIIDEYIESFQFKNNIIKSSY
jgi:hypothetical protein